MSTTVDQPRSSRAALAAVLCAGAIVAVVLGVYAKEHTPAGRPLFMLGFSGMLQMKVWLTTAATSLLLVQLGTALWMYRSRKGCPPWAQTLHRTSGSVAFVLTLPVGFHCIWALGYSDTTTRTLIHSLLGCAFYGAYAAKMLALRVGRLPGWAVPVFGGLVLCVLVGIWLTSALWFFTRTGLPLT